MTSLRILILLLGVCIMAVMTCAPSTPKKKHGYCKFYVDGSSDTSSGRKKRQATAMASASGTPTGTAPASPGTSGSGKSSGEASGKFNRTKKKKNVKCYEYEDGTKDDGAVLNNGVTYMASASSSG
ncbi:unnamed protein product [Caenorhabditis brenneri]